MNSKITSSSTAEYFAKNLQQVGFSSPTKAVLTTLKEAVDNSLDACEGVSILPEISVTISKKGIGSQKNTDLVEIIVEDNGPGVPEKQLKLLGKPFFRADSSRSRKTGGTGLGLAIVKQIAQVHSLFIEFQNKPTGGLMVILTEI